MIERKEEDKKSRKLLVSRLMKGPEQSRDRVMWMMVNLVYKLTGNQTRGVLLVLIVSQNEEDVFKLLPVIKCLVIELGLRD